MANTLYDNGRQLFLTGGINWTADTIKCSLVDGTYAPNFSNDAVLTNIGNNHFIAPTANTQAGAVLTNKQAIAGAAKADNVTFSSVASNLAQAAALIIWKDTGLDIPTFPLIAYINAATGLPITPNGGDIIVVWDTGVNRIFRL